MDKKKTRNACEECRWGFDNYCMKTMYCTGCPRFIEVPFYTKRCKCLLVKEGKPCKDYEKYTGDKDNG